MDTYIEDGKHKDIPEWYQDFLETFRDNSYVSKQILLGKLESLCSSLNKELADPNL